jgi:thiol-disulfide isomerase/thioredoxin
LNAADLAGRPWDLKAFAGHALLLNFWASYCAPCQIEMPGLNRLQARFGPQGLRVAGLNHGEMPERVRLFLTRVPFAGQVLLDRSQTQLAAWGSQALPTSVLIDAQGLARWWHVGELDWDAPAVQAQVRAVLPTS